MYIINGIDMDIIKEVQKFMITNKKTRDLINSIMNSWISVAL